MRGHESRVRSVAYSPDGTRIVSGGDDDIVRQWDATSGAPIGVPMRGHEDWVWSVAYSPDGTRIVSGGDDGTVRQWETVSGAPIGVSMRGHESRVRSVAYSPDGTRIVSGGDDDIVRQWDATSGAPIGVPMRGHEDWVWSVAYSPDGTRIVSGGDDGTVRLWDIGSLIPPLLVWILLMAATGALFLFVQLLPSAWQSSEPPDEPTDEPNEADVPNIEHDNPIEHPDQATKAMRDVATRIFRFVRNPDASAPLTFALTGKWGSGKSSLMKLVERDLYNARCPYVWFNAWHHQNETHLFAALMESIRRNTVPRSLFEYFKFHFNLARLRYRKTRFTVILFGVVSLSAFIWIGWRIFPDPTFWRAVFSGSWTDLQELNLPLLPLIIVFWAFVSRWNPLRAFGVTPASLVRASAAWVQFPRFQDRLSFRHQFGRAFGEVCKAFDDRRLVIIVDDLDRCRPSQIVEILEAVNFLMSNGECFVLLGIDEAYVRRAVGLYYKDIAEELRKEEQHSEGHTGKGEDNRRGAGEPASEMSEIRKSKARQAYADHYLEKLINLSVKVPVVNDQDLLVLRKVDD